MSQVLCSVYAFLSATEGNWRNAIYVECRQQNCQYFPCCGAFLLSSDADGRPLLLPPAALQVCCGQEVDKYECAGYLEKSALVSAYRRFFDWHTETDRECVLRQYLFSQPLPPCGADSPIRKTYNKEVFP